MKIRHLYSFLPMFILLSVLALCFLSEITLFAIFDKAEAFVVLATTTKQPYAVSIYQNIKKPYVVSHETKHKKHRTHAALSKQFKFIIPGICYKASL